MEKRELSNLDFSSLNPRQQKIYDGLKTIGPLPAAFYRDAVNIINQSSVDTKSYLIAHLARELDGSIRDVFSLLEEKGELTHLDIVVRCLGLSEMSPFAIDWQEISSQFPKLAHRSKPFNAPREAEKILELWQRYENILYQLVGNYFALQRRLEVAIAIDSPTKTFLKTLPNLLALDASKFYFFKSIRSAKWLNGLIDTGWYNPDNAPTPIQVDGGYQRQRWFPLLYLENLAQSFKEENNLELVPDILEIIQQTTERHHKKNDLDNDFIWPSFIKILANIPNRLVPLTILDLIPVWLTTRFNTFGSTDELLEKLLPKFLNESSAENDVEKAEKILEYMLAAKKIKRQHSIHQIIPRQPSYEPVIYLGLWQSALDKSNLCEQIGKLCSVHCILKIASTFKKVIRDIPSGLTTSFSIDGDEYEMNLSVSDDQNDLTIRCYRKGQMEIEKALLHVTIQDFERYSNEEIKETITFKLLNGDLTVLSKNFFSSLDHLLDMLSGWDDFMFAKSIHEDSKHYYQEKLSYSLLYFLKDVLIQKGKYNPKELQEIIKAFLGSQFKLPVFRRLAFYLISENWASQNDLFWKVIEHDDAHGYFSMHGVWRDLYFLLKNNVKKFSENQKKLIDGIVEGIPKDESEKQYAEHRKLKWYSALSKDEYFAGNYQRLSEKLHRTREYYEKSDVISVRSGSISPYKDEELLTMENEEIVERILSFHPKDHWEEPNISGFTSVLRESVKANPDHFAKDISLYKNVYFIYVYHLLDGFKSAWEAKKNINWNNVLEFCRDYISQEAFKQQLLKIDNDNWDANSESVSRVVAQLITAGLRNDGNAFDESLLPLAEEILFLLSENIAPRNDFEKTNMGYVDYVLNSHNGIVLESVIELELRKARLKSRDGDAIKWESKPRKLFDDALDNGILDAYILCGWLFKQFYFLDKQWILDNAKKFNTIDEKFRNAFIGGYFSENPLYDKAVYNLMYPYYQLAIESNQSYNHLSDRALARHLFHILYWDFEIVGEDNLVTKLLSSSSAEMVSDFVSFLWYIHDKVEFIDPNERKSFKDQVLKVWRMILLRFQNSNDAKEREAIFSCHHLDSYVEQLEETSFALIMETVPYLKESYQAHDLIEFLNEKKSVGDSLAVAIMIGKIFTQILLVSKPDYPEDAIREIVEFLYNQMNDETKTYADHICEEYARAGNQFLKELFNRFNKLP